MDNGQQLGQRIRHVRRFRDMTQRELATSVDLSEGMIARLEQGRVGDLGATKVARIAAVLKVSADYLLGLSDDFPKAA